MKLMQHILSKGLLIAIVVLIAMGYHFRTQLFPQWFVKPAPEQPTAQQNPPQDLAPMGQAPAPLAVVPAPAQPLPPVSTEPPPAPLPEPLPEPPAEAMPPVSAPADTAAPMAPEEAQAPSATAPDAADTAPAMPAAPDAATLDAARAAFWAQDFSQAEQMYKQLADADPAAADPVGELGNLYYAQGRWNDAADAYAAAVTRLAKTGDMPRAWHLLRVLDDLDPLRARSLRESGVVGGG